MVCAIKVERSIGVEAVVVFEAVAVPESFAVLVALVGVVGTGLLVTVVFPPERRAVAWAKRTERSDLSVDVFGEDAVVGLMGPPAFVAAVGCALAARAAAWMIIAERLEPGVIGVAEIFAAVVVVMAGATGVAGDVFAAVVVVVVPEFAVFGEWAGGFAGGAGVLFD